MSDSTRCGELSRETKETQVSMLFDLDGSGVARIDIAVGFFKHMLESFVRHGSFEMTLQATGDTWVDDHHLVEDTGIVLGAVTREALGEKVGISRFGSAIIPMDEALVLCAIDISGRGSAHIEVPFPCERIGQFDTQLIKEFFDAFAREAGITVHLRLLAGENAHHIAEACFKAFGRALRDAVMLDARSVDVPSTKGVL